MSYWDASSENTTSNLQPSSDFGPASCQNNVEERKINELLGSFAERIRTEFHSSQRGYARAAILLLRAYTHGGLNEQSYTQWACEELGLSKNQARRMRTFAEPFEHLVNLEDEDDPVIKNMAELSPSVFEVLSKLPEGSYEVTSDGQVYLTIEALGYAFTPVTELSVRDIERIRHQLKTSTEESEGDETDESTPAKLQTVDSGEVAGQCQAVNELQAGADISQPADDSEVIPNKTVTEESQIHAHSKSNDTPSNLPYRNTKVDEDDVSDDAEGDDIPVHHAHPDTEVDEDGDDVTDEVKSDCKSTTGTNELEGSVQEESVVEPAFPSADVPAHWHTELVPSKVEYLGGVPKSDIDDVLLTTVNATVKYENGAWMEEVIDGSKYALVVYRRDSSDTEYRIWDAFGQTWLSVAPVGTQS